MRYFKAVGILVLALFLLGLAPHMAHSQALDLGQRMDRIAAEKARDDAKNDATENNQATDNFQQNLISLQEERGNVLGLFAEEGSCPAWTDNTYVACDCEANDLPDRNAKIVWRSACGVMALEKYSGAMFDSVAQLNCALKSDFQQQVRDQVAGSGASGSLSYADQAWQRWSQSTGCQGNPIPQSTAFGAADDAAMTCSLDDFAVPNAEIPIKQGALTCADGSRKPYQVELKMGFIFRITDSDGRVAVYNASRNKDPETGAYLLDPQFVAGVVCHVQADRSTAERFHIWLKDYVREYMKRQSTGLHIRRKSACIGVRG